MKNIFLQSYMIQHSKINGGSEPETLDFSSRLV